MVGRRGFLCSRMGFLVSRSEFFGGEVDVDLGGGKGYEGTQNTMHAVCGTVET